MRYIFYAYPLFKRVSFNEIAEKHVEQLKKYFRVECIDEHALPFLGGILRPFILLQPYFYPFQNYEKQLTRKLGKWKGIIGIDVADSNRISQYAVRLTSYANAMIVPSTFARNSYVNSGVKKPVYVVPHGVDDEWITHEKTMPSTFKYLEYIKRVKGKKVIVSFIVHSEYRKGLDLLIEIYNRLRRERKDVILAIKDAFGVKIVEDKEKRIHNRWLTQQEKMELFDLSDLYLLTSRGGGFEHPPLEAIARGVPAIGAEGGAWQDYMCKWMLVPSKPSGIVLAGNPIHVGIGVEMIIEKAVNKAHEILDNLDEYKAKTREYANTVIKEKFTWTRVGLLLKKVVERHISEAI